MTESPIHTLLDRVDDLHLLSEILPRLPFVGYTIDDTAFKLGGGIDAYVNVALHFTKAHAELHLWLPLLRSAKATLHVNECPVLPTWAVDDGNSRQVVQLFFGRRLTCAKGGLEYVVDGVVLNAARLATAVKDGKTHTVLKRYRPHKLTMELDFVDVVDPKLGAALEVYFETFLDGRYATEEAHRHHAQYLVVEKRRKLAAKTGAAPPLPLSGLIREVLGRP